MTKLLRTTLVAVSLLTLCSGMAPASADARRGGHFVGGYGPHHRGGHEVGGHQVRHPLRALLRRL